jgi:hypothetical protein
MKIQNSKVKSQKKSEVRDTKEFKAKDKERRGLTIKDKLRSFSS